MTWSRLWDDVMDLGSWQVRGLQNISRVLSAHGRGSKPCPRCEVEDLDSSLLDHLVERHKEELRLGDVDEKTVIENLKALNLNFLNKFSTLY